MTGSVAWEDVEVMSDKDLAALAVESNPGLTYARVEPGVTMLLQMTRCVNLWRNEECYLAGDKPRGVLEGFPPYKPAIERLTEAVRKGNQ